MADAPTEERRLDAERQKGLYVIRHPDATVLCSDYHFAWNLAGILSQLTGSTVEIHCGHKEIIPVGVTPLSTVAEEAAALASAASV